MIEFTIDQYDSPIGSITLLGFEGELVYLDFSENDRRLDRLMSQRYGGHTLKSRGRWNDMHQRMDRYFEKDWGAFDGLALNPKGTRFQQRVWEKLQAIGPGSTASYSDLAESVGNPKAIRAAASSNARNPIAIIIPCHRVIGKDGALRGYAGGEHRKRWLLEHEGWSFSG